MQQTHTEPTSSRSPKPTNDKQLTNQHWALLSPCQKILSIGGPKIKGQKTQSTVEAIHGETGFARVFGHQNEGHKFRRTQFIFGFVNGQAHAQAFVENG